MVIGIFGESCTGKSTIVDELTKRLNAKIYTGKLLTVFCLIAGLLNTQADIFFFVLAVFIVYLSVNLFSWGLAQKDAVKINDALKTLQSG